jgi:SAM-dependent methyltransferase
MNRIFGSGYAEAYDLIYSDKDYLSECALVERIFETQSHLPIKSVIDFGCGTGNHAIPLAARGYSVVGVDLHEEMLQQARKKLQKHAPDANVQFVQGDLRNVDLNKKFDAALILFAVLGYQNSNQEVLSALKSVRRHLNSGGLTLFDVWYGPAVLINKPSHRLKVIPTPEGQILRFASGELNTSTHLCKVRYHLWKIENGRVAAEINEEHSMRYFFYQELALFLHQSGLELIRLGGFPQFDHDPDETTWNVMGVARAI